ncbi:rod shape-determining protein, partial [Citrobacter sp. AAK_AS5]
PPTLQAAAGEAIEAARHAAMAENKGKYVVVVDGSVPMKDGGIADFTVTEKMLQYFIHKAHESLFMRPSPRVLICVP